MRPLFQIRNRYLLLVDLVLITAAVLASFALRLDLGPAFTYYLPSAWTTAGLLLLWPLPALLGLCKRP